MYLFVCDSKIVLTSQFKFYSLFYLKYDEKIITFQFVWVQCYWLETQLCISFPVHVPFFFQIVSTECSPVLHWAERIVALKFSISTFFKLRASVHFKIYWVWNSYDLKYVVYPSSLIRSFLKLYECTNRCWNYCFRCWFCWDGFYLLIYFMNLFFNKLGNLLLFLHVRIRK